MVDLRNLLLGVMPFVIVAVAISLLLTTVLISLMRAGGAVVLWAAITVASRIRHCAYYVSRRPRCHEQELYLLGPPDCPWL